MTVHWCRPFGSEGFTLFEVLAATVLAGVFLALCFVGFSQEKRRLHQAEQAQATTSVLRYTLWFLDQKDLQGRLPAVIEMPRDLAAWRVTVEHGQCPVFLGEGAEGTELVPLAGYMQRAVVIQSPDGRRYLLRRLVENQ